MRLVSLAAIEGTERDVATEDWRSRRLILAGDNSGYSLHDTLIYAGAELRLHYTNHIEAVYCIEGTGEVIVEDTGERHPLEPGTLYVLDQHDEHILRAKDQLRTVCVFTPAVTGREVHDEEGRFPPPEAVSEAVS